MAFDPRCVSFEGRLLADCRTAEYMGRANHVADAACFRSRRAVGANASSLRLRVFYFETQIVTTCSAPTSELAANSLPPRISISNSSATIRRHAAQDRDAAATTARDWRRRAELEAMDMEDVQVPALTGGSGGVPVNFNFSLNSRSIQLMRSRIDQRRLRRSSERKRFNHKIAVGFILDEPEQKMTRSGQISRGFTSFSTASGFLEARRTVKQLMQRVLPDNDSESSSERGEGGDKKSGRMFPTILHRDLGDSVNSLAYVGKTGRIVSHGREFMQCERYGAGDVVGCGVLLDTNTFFFTLNGKLMGMLAARDVYDLDDFGEVEGFEEDESEEDDTDSDEEDDRDGVQADRDVNTLLDGVNDVEMEDFDGRHDDEKAIYPAVSLHGAGECVQGIFEPEEFQFDLSEFEQQIQKGRQRALLAERETRSETGVPSAVEQSECKDEAAMNELVQDFLLHYGYKNAYEAFEVALTPSKRQRLSLDGLELDYSDEADVNSLTLGLNSVQDMEEESKREDVDYEDTQTRVDSPLKQLMRESLSLRHEVSDHIRCFRTAQALVVLEQHVPALLKNWSGHRSRRLRKLLLYCRILCVIDVLTNEDETKAAACSTNGASTPSFTMDTDEVSHNGWNTELAVEFARQIFGSTSESITNGKRKRQDSGNGTQTSNGTQNKREGTDDVALAMSLLLYNERKNIPATSRAQKFLTPEFRGSVADQLNNLLLVTNDPAKAEPRVSALEAFMNDLGKLQKECLHQGCRVYPESVETTSNGTSKTSSHRRRASVSSSSDDSSSSQTEQDDRLDDDDDE